MTTGAGAIFGLNAGSQGTGTISAGGAWSAQNITVGSSGVGKLTVSGGTISTAAGFSVGQNSGSQGTVSVTGGSITAGGNAVIGNNGVGTVTIGAGGSIIANGTFDAIGNNVGAVGDLVINSGGLFQIGGTADVGNNAGSAGAVVINAGGHLKYTLPAQTSSIALSIGRAAPTGAQQGAGGSVLVSGAGALLDTNDNPIAVGQGGFGDLTVSQGGSVAVGTPDPNLIYGLGIAYSGGTGSVTVTDPGSTFTLTGFGFDGRGGSGALTIKNSGSFIVNDAPVNDGGFSIGVGRGAGPTAPTNIGGNGVAVVTSGGVLDINSLTSGIGVGGNGANGVLNVDNGGTVLTGTGMTIGTATLASGTIYGGTGALNIGPGGVVRVNNPALTGVAITIGGANSSIGGATNAATGEALVSGAGALLDGNGAGLAVGLFSDGSLVISQGGSVASGTPDNAAFAAVGVGREATGSITITDTGSNETANGLVYIGRAAAGVLTVENHGSLSVGVDGKGNGGLNIGGAGLANGATLYAGGSGTGLVTANGNVFSTQNVKVGENGTDGALTIDNGGTVEAGQRVLLGSSITLTAGDTIVSSGSAIPVTSTTVATASGAIAVGSGGLLKADGNGIAAGTPVLVIGNDDSSSGNLDVSGAGAQVISVGQMDVGNVGNGQLLVRNTATVTTGNSAADPNAGFDVAAGSGGLGSATVAENSLLTNTGRFVVGDLGVGSLTIQGTVVTNPGTVGGLPGADIAAQAGSDGSNVSVIGAGSKWQIGGSLLVGGGAAGSLSIISGGTVTAATADLSPTSNGTGLVSLSGPASNLTLSGALTVGDANSAELVIQGGATVSASSADIGAQAQGTGNVDVEGAGSQLLTAGKLIIGDQGNAQLTIGAGAAVHATGGFFVGVGGVVTQFGGVLDPPGPSVNLGTIGGVGQTVGDVENDGTIYAKNGIYEVTGNITTGIGQAGSLIVNSGVSDLVLDQSVDSGQSALFGATTGTLTIGQPGSFAATIFNFKAGDIIQALGASSGTFDTTADVLTLNTGATLQFFGKYTDPTLFHVAGDGTVSLSPPCFAEGTRISAERGEVAVESLLVGDRVQVIGSRLSSQLITWIGRRTVDCTRHPDPRKVWPVRIEAGAFGPGRPVRDLYLSPNHAGGHRRCADPGEASDQRLDDRAGAG